jgi:hypothetical protein
MSMMRKLFRPGQGQTIEAYTTAVASEAMYPHDFVSLVSTDPTSQGSSGVFEGKTLGDYDYIECALTLVATNRTCLGVLMGKSIDAVSNIADVSGEVLADGDVAVIQYRGVHPRCSQAATGLIDEYLIASSTGGEASNVLSAAAGTTGDTGILGQTLEATAANYTRATGVTNDGGAAYIRL